MRYRAWCLLVILAAAACGREPPQTVEAPRPVSILVLAESDPVEPLLLSGSVRAWQEQDVAFEVEGTVRFVAESSTNLAGRWVEDGEVRIEGDRLAVLDPTSYEISKAQAQAYVVVAEKKLQATRVERERVLPAQLAAAKAQLERAEETFKRDEQAYKKNAISGVDFIRSRSDRDTRRAEFEEAKASQDTKDAEIAALEAELDRSKEDLRQAQYNLDRCTLHAPFTAEVSEVHVEAGGFARRGEPVAHLVMMTPIKVDLAVSPATARAMQIGNVVRIHLPGLQEPAIGRVYDKATTADPETRTFRVSIITLNELMRTEFTEDDPRSSLPQLARYLFLLASPMQRHEGMYYAEERRALRKDTEGWFIWTDPTRKFDESIPLGTVLTLKKTRVKPGDTRYNLQGLYLVRELADIGDAVPGSLVALDVPKTDADEIEVVLSRPRWRLRPGQIVPVLLADKAPRPGLYVPMDAIKPTGEKTGIVFLEEDGTARRVEVKITDRVGAMFRIEGEGVTAGVHVIRDFIHFLQDGEKVRVTRRRDEK